MLADTAERLRKRDENLRTEPNERELMVKAAYLFYLGYDGEGRFCPTFDLRNMNKKHALRLFGVDKAGLARILQRCDAIDAHSSAQK